jgi:hypothetical protein
MSAHDFDRLRERSGFLSSQMERHPDNPHDWIVRQVIDAWNPEVWFLLRELLTVLDWNEEPVRKSMIKERLATLLGQPLSSWDRPDERYVEARIARKSAEWTEENGATE